MDNLQHLQERPYLQQSSNETTCKTLSWIAGGVALERRFIIGVLQDSQVAGASTLHHHHPPQGSQPHHQVGPPVSRTVVQH